MARVHNFSPGPGTLPTEVLASARDELLDYEGTGISMLEHSHRGPAYSAVHEATKERLLRLLGISESHDALFMTGGATTQFSLVPMNYLEKDGAKGAYVDTGTWSVKAAKAAKYFGTSETIASGREGERVVRVPDFDAQVDARYVHITSNATVMGVQFASLPDTKAPLVVDMSSDILSRPMDLSKAALIYAGAQKTLGPAGVTLVLVRKDFLAEASQEIPSIFSYRYFAENDSLGNTAPTFPIYMVGKVLEWVEQQGGVEEMGARNQKKSDLLYGCVDEHADFYHCPVEEGSRSQMNAVFNLPSDELTTAFLAEAKKHELVNLKGHRSVGGVRVSMYNALPVASVEKLVDLMRDFVKRA